MAAVILATPAAAQDDFDPLREAEQSGAPIPEFEDRYNATDFRAPIAQPIGDAWGATMEELEANEQWLFAELFATLDSSQRSGFLGVAAWMRQGDRGTLVGLLLRSTPHEQRALLSLFGAVGPSGHRYIANELDFAQPDHWPKLVHYVGIAPLEEARTVVFGPGLKAACGLSPIEEENVFAANDAAAAPYDPDCHARAAPLRHQWIYVGSRRRGARFIVATAAAAPWQGELRRAGTSAAQFSGPLAIRRERERLGLPLKDWERQHICGAVYIGENWVLTAAHCIGLEMGDNFIANRSLRLGSTRLDRAMQDLPIDAAVYHGAYKEDGTYRNDIALLRLARPPRTGPMSAGGALPVGLPARGARPPGPNDDLQVTGWGYSEISNDSSAAVGRSGRVQKFNPILGKGTFQRWSNARCEANPVIKGEGWKIYPGQFCAGSKLGQDSCKGDSGGPMVWLRPGGPVLVGLVSYGKGCGIEGAPGIYTDVAAFVDWIGRAKSKAQTGRVIPIK